MVSHDLLDVVSCITGEHVAVSLNNYVLVYKIENEKLVYDFHVDSPDEISCIQFSKDGE